jgi:hypothetical protein
MRRKERLALPAHEEDGLPMVTSEPRWWQWWRKGK